MAVTNKFAKAISGSIIQNSENSSKFVRDDCPKIIQYLEHKDNSQPEAGLTHKKKTLTLEEKPIIVPSPWLNRVCDLKHLASTLTITCGNYGYIDIKNHFCRKTYVLPNNCSYL